MGSGRLCGTLARHYLETELACWALFETMGQLMTFQTAPTSQRFNCLLVLLAIRRLRNLIRALCNCDLLLPREHPNIAAISWCSYPSTSCKTKIVRQPRGRPAIALVKSNRLIDPANLASSSPDSLMGARSSPSKALPCGTVARVFLRKYINTKFTVVRCNHVANAASPRNVPIFRKTCRKTS